MLRYQFKTCITKGRELYAFVEEELNDRWMSTRSEMFPESLLSFLYLDIEQMRLTFQSLSDEVRRVVAEKTERNQSGSCVRRRCMI